MAAAHAIVYRISALASLPARLLESGERGLPRLRPGISSRGTPSEEREHQPDGNHNGKRSAERDQEPARGTPHVLRPAMPVGQQPLVFTASHRRRLPTK
jgi:hypothetical protein